MIEKRKAFHTIISTNHCLLSEKIMQRTKIYRVYEAKYTPSGGKVQKLDADTVIANNLADAVGKYLSQVTLSGGSVESGKLELKIEQTGAQG